jgi:tripartite-type tricarboxylate transporter receptor subunit TctC
MHIVPKRSLIAAAAAALLLMPLTARAEYPEKTIKVIVPFNPGGFVDSVGRIFTDKIGHAIGGTMIVENRGGAGGKIGEEAVARAPADGYTLLVSAVTRPTLMQITKPATPDLDILKSFEVVGVLGTSPMTMNAAPKLGVSDFKSLIAKVKAEPGKHSYGSPGPGTPSHIFSAQLAKLFDLKVVHVPYRGAGHVLNDLVAGNLSWSVDTPITSMALIHAKKIVPMLVTSEKRVKQLPNVPTAAEVGYPQFTGETMTIYLLAPKGTAKPILERLNTAVVQAAKDSALEARLDNLALIPPPKDDSLANAHAVAAREIDTWAKAVKLIGKP